MTADFGPCTARSHVPTSPPTPTGGTERSLDPPPDALELPISQEGDPPSRRPSLPISHQGPPSPIASRCRGQKRRSLFLLLAHVVQPRWHPEAQECDSTALTRRSSRSLHCTATFSPRGSSQPARCIGRRLAIPSGEEYRGRHIFGTAHRSQFVAHRQNESSDRAWQSRSR